MLFYPAHDMALATGVRHYNQPAFTARMQADLESLAQWWQDEEPGAAPIPWGWDYDTRAALRQAGVPPERLPDDDALRTLRSLSSREQTTGIVGALTDLCPTVTPPLRIDSLPQLEALVLEAETSGKSFVLKTPWSSSGRGLMRYVPGQSDSAKRHETLRRHAAAVIGHMGCIMAEPWYDKRQDFAMLFRIRRDSVEWIGYSLFETDDNGTYRCGLLDSNEAIETRLTGGNPAMRSILGAIRQRYTDILLPERFATLTGRSWEVGYVGIDMMTLAAEDALHPCVEMNVRCTMGIVARRMFDRGISDGKPAKFSIKSHSDGHFTAEIDYFR